MKEWQKQVALIAIGFAIVYMWRSAHGDEVVPESVRKWWNGYEVSDEQKAMLDAQDAAFSNTMDFTTGPFIPFVVDYSLRR